MCEIKWKEQFAWESFYDVELLVAAEETVRWQFLPVWGWGKAALRYRLAYGDEDEECGLYLRVQMDVFEHEDGRVLVVDQGWMCGDGDGGGGEDGWEEDATAHVSVWEAPARCAEVPRHLVGGRVEDIKREWLFYLVMGVAVRWNETCVLPLTERLRGAVEEEFVEDRLEKAAESALSQELFGFSELVTAAPEPLMVGRYPMERGEDVWGFLYRVGVNDLPMFLVLTLKKSVDGRYAHKFYVSFDVDEGMLDSPQAALEFMAEYVFDVFALEGGQRDVPF